MKILKNYAIVILTLAVVLGGCGSKKDDPKPGGKAHKVVVKAEVSAGSKVLVANYGTESTATPVTGLSGTTWTSPEFTVPAGTSFVRAAVGGEGPNASATIKVQIYIDGEFKKEGVGSGTSLSAIVIHEL